MPNSALLNFSRIISAAEFSHKQIRRLALDIFFQRLFKKKKKKKNISHRH